MNSNYYSVLGVSATATYDQIKKSWRAKVLECHPDKNAGSKQAEEQFKSVQTAWEVLGDESKRREYDDKTRRGYAERTSRNYADEKRRDDDEERWTKAQRAWQAKQEEEEGLLRHLRRRDELRTQERQRQEQRERREMERMQREEQRRQREAQRETERFDRQARAAHSRSQSRSHPGSGSSVSYTNSSIHNYYGSPGRPVVVIQRLDGRSIFVNNHIDDDNGNIDIRVSKSGGTINISVRR